MTEPLKLHVPDMFEQDIIDFKNGKVANFYWIYLCPTSDKSSQYFAIKDAGKNILIECGETKIELSKKQWIKYLEMSMEE